MRSIRRIDRSLRNVAERHPNDTIANSASALAVKLETLGLNFGTRQEEITDLDRHLIKFSISWNDQNMFTE